MSENQVDIILTQSNISGFFAQRRVLSLPQGLFIPGEADCFGQLVLSSTNEVLLRVDPSSNWFVKRHRWINVGCGEIDMVDVQSECEIISGDALVTYTQPVGGSIGGIVFLARISLNGKVVGEHTWTPPVSSKTLSSAVTDKESLDEDSGVAHKPSPSATQTPSPEMSSRAGADEIHFRDGPKIPLAPAKLRESVDSEVSLHDLMRQLLVQVDSLDSQEDRIVGWIKGTQRRLSKIEEEIAALQSRHESATHATMALLTHSQAMVTDFAALIAGTQARGDLSSVESKIKRIESSLSMLNSKVNSLLDAGLPSYLDNQRNLLLKLRTELTKLEKANNSSCSDLIEEIGTLVKQLAGTVKHIE